VYRLGEVHEHPHNVARGAFRETPAGGRELVPAPRFSRTPGQPGPNYAYAGADTDAVLGEAGLSIDEIDKLRAAGAVA
jgi:alpha-methylacyl-CoA racemase